MVRLLFVVVGWCGFVDGCLLVCDGEYLGDMILCEFGMLIVGVELVWCSGEICVLMGIVFCVLECQDEQIVVWEWVFDMMMIGIVEDDFGYVEFYVDVQGCVFMMNCVMDGVYLVGFMFGDVIECVLFGWVVILLLFDEQVLIVYYGVYLMGDDLCVMIVVQLLVGNEGLCVVL